MSKVQDINYLVNPDTLAHQISNQYLTWGQERRTWEDRMLEIQKYVFATDTTQTTNAKLPWKNKTTLPKLCQIRDNLHANYMAALFPHDDWLKWEAGDRLSRKKADAIEAYMKNKLNMSDFRDTVSRLVYDYIDYGNAFADVEFINEQITDPITGEITPGYIGPRLVRVPPVDIVFNISAVRFEESPKITRHLCSLGTLTKRAKMLPEEAMYAQKVDRAMYMRRQISSLQQPDMFKDAIYQIAGFGSFQSYLSSGLVELLVFEGDLYIEATGELKENHRVVIMDRSYVIEDEPIKTWTGKSLKRHVGWRLRNDNLMAMGPLENLVGMQYRIDHLENLKADVFDLIAHPPIKVQGMVEEFEWGPYEKIFMDEGANVEMMTPDTNALSADFQIQTAERKMEEYAGAPREAMGIRTPGEKTAYEVQVLENGASRIFQNKVSHFEAQFLEPLLNAMLESARRNLQGADVVRVMDNELGAKAFLKITKEDITAKGKLRAQGARHFARQAQLVQNLTQLMSSPVGQDTSVSVHISGLRTAEMMEDALGLKKYELVQKNIRLLEQADTQRMLQSIQQVNQQTNQAMATPVEDEEEMPHEEEAPVQ